jgi:hypothetical protein
MRRGRASKCISFNGASHCTPSTASGGLLRRPAVRPLSSGPLHDADPESLTESSLGSRGCGRGMGGLWWRSHLQYHPLDAQAHGPKLAPVAPPTLPVHIHESHYAALLSNPPSSSPSPSPSPSPAPAQPAPSASVGVLTSLTGIAVSARADGGVGPQVLSHVFGLRKAYEGRQLRRRNVEQVPGRQVAG